MRKILSQERAVWEQETELAALKADLEAGQRGRAAETEQWVSPSPNRLGTAKGWGNCELSSC